MTSREEFFAAQEKRRAVIYFIVSEECQQFKIGHALDVRKRLAALRTDCPGEPYLKGFIRFTTRIEAREYEYNLHQRFDAYRVRPTGEWFRLDEDSQAMIEEAVFEYLNPLEELFEEYF